MYKIIETILAVIYFGGAGLFLFLLAVSEFMKKENKIWRK